MRLTFLPFFIFIYLFYFWTGIASLHAVRISSCNRLTLLGFKGDFPRYFCTKLHGRRCRVSPWSSSPSHPVLYSLSLSLSLSVPLSLSPSLRLSFLFLSAACSSLLHATLRYDHVANIVILRSYPPFPFMSTFGAPVAIGTGKSFHRNSFIRQVLTSFRITALNRLTIFCSMIVYNETYLWKLYIYR